MALLCAAINIRSHSDSFLRFPFCSHVKVFTCVISSVCCLKSPYICFSSLFYFLFFVVYLSSLILPLLLVAADYRKPDIGMMVRVFANGPADLRSIPGQIIPKTQNIVLDASLFNIQHYKVQIKGKVEKSRERSSALPYTLV